MLGRAVALWCAVLVTCAYASAYTVDCNRELTDCDEHLKNFTSEESRMASTTVTDNPELIPKTNVENNSESIDFDHIIDGSGDHHHGDRQSDPKDSYMNYKIENFFPISSKIQKHHGLGRQNKKLSPDLSDVNLDNDEEEEVPIMGHKQSSTAKDKIMDPLKFLSSLSQSPLRPIHHSMDSEDNNRVCMDKGKTYMYGETLERECEESCLCMTDGRFECTPRCKKPFIRRGSLGHSDPLCFETHVDDCCSIVACANHDSKPPNKTEDSANSICRFNNTMYESGTTWHVGCEQTCTCENGYAMCRPRCEEVKPSEKCINVPDPADTCCEMQVCDVTHDAHEDNTTVASMDNTSTLPTVDLPTPVTEKPKEHKPHLHVPSRPLVLTEPIGSVKVLQNNSVQVTLMHMNSSEDPIHLLLSDDGGNTFKNIKLAYSNLILNLEGGKDYILKTAETDTKFNFTITAADHATIGMLDEEKNHTEEVGCYEDGKFYKVGEEFHIGCTELCECVAEGERECAALSCPAGVGLELVWRACVKWAPAAPPAPPHCCPRPQRCLSTGTCTYNDVQIPNWSEVPISLTGCEKRCFCENGELECQEVCSPLPAIPPQTLRCPPNHRIAPVNISDEDCCQEWGCILTPGAMTTPMPVKKPALPFLPTLPPQSPPETSHEIHYPHDDLVDYDQNNVHKPIIPHPIGNLPNIPGLAGLPPVPAGYGEVNKKLTVISLQADSPSSVKMLFGLPPVLVGLRGSVDLRYTDKDDEEISHWYSQVFAPADEVLTTSRLEFRLSGLKPSTLYKVRAKLYLHNLPVEPESDVYTVRTQDLPVVEEKRREIDSLLSVVEVNDTTAHVTWRHFTEDELRFIDGIQIRYRPVGTPIYLMTELLHNRRTSTELRELRPETQYEVSIVLPAPPQARTELYDSNTRQFTTAQHVDPYGWSVRAEIMTVGALGVQVSWRGVPEPAERWVRVFRAAHACDSERERDRDRDREREKDAFRLATRDQPAHITLTHLPPHSKCRVWLELFLTNGKVKTSNVLEINTKSLDEPETIDNVIEASSIAGSRGASRGDYYGALVAVGVIAALGAVTSLLLLLIVVRRHRPRTHNITPIPSAPRESSLPPYDNPAYKLELQQETMDL